MSLVRTDVLLGVAIGEAPSSVKASDPRLFERPERPQVVSEPVLDLTDFEMDDLGWSDLDPSDVTSGELR